MKDFRGVEIYLLGKMVVLNSGGISVACQIEYLMFFVSVTSSLMFADQIVLKNGDRLTGTVVKSDGKILVLHTEFAGDVTLRYEAITQITTDEQLHVGLKKGQTVVGPLTTSDGKIKGCTKAAGTVDP